MASRNYSYQFETSPKKLKQEYYNNKSIKSTNTNKKTNNGKNDNRNNYYKNNKKIDKNKAQIAHQKDKKISTNTKKQSKIQKQNKEISKAKFGIFVKSVLLFAIFFFVLFRNSEINESFSKIQALKAEITAIQKENDQLEISIQNSLNINNIEKEAKELLGMQKLTNKQTVYINLPKKDYVEHRAEEVSITKEEKGFLKSVKSFIEHLF